ncbi:MAG: hypothetical protein JSU03_13090 [Bacteroidetes bacterium]|nr:hypothetical protein [Bacteroidota bacterium]
MKRLFLLNILLIPCLSAVSQSTNMKSSIGVSIPVIWNNSEATYYQLGNPKYPSGKAISYGLNIDYSHTLYKGIYGKIGVGYFKQMYAIKRPFNYSSPIQFGWSTESYSYDNVHVYGGAFYKMTISEKTNLNGGITYNQYYSFRQKYINASPVPNQINHKSISLGSSADLEIGAERIISKKVSVAANIVYPVYTHWNKDEIFIYYGYSDDTQQIARNKFSTGIVVSCNYNF